MQILVISHYWYPENGVPQRRWSWLVDILTSAGHQVTVVAPPPHYQRRVGVRQWILQRGYRAQRQSETGLSGESVIRSGYVPAGMSLTGKTLNQLWVALSSARLILSSERVRLSHSPDLIVGTVPALPTAVIAAICARRFNVPYVIDLRDAWPELFGVAAKWNNSVGRPSWRQRMISSKLVRIGASVTSRILMRVYRGAASIMVTSSYLADALNTALPSDSGAVTIRNVFPAETVVTRPLYDLSPKSKIRVLYAGTLGRAQNLANALYAAGIAQEKGLVVQLRFVGAGAAKQTLAALAQELELDVSFEKRHPANDLTEHYLWADTALVHLTDWEPLNRAVPSKTYELMLQRIHITGVVAGETAELISDLEAGDVVAPEEPESLANLWLELANDPARLRIGSKAAEWVMNQQTDVAPRAFLQCIDEAGVRE